MRLGLTISIFFLAHFLGAKTPYSDTTISRIEKLTSPRTKAISYDKATDWAWQNGYLNEALEYSERGLKIAQSSGLKDIESSLHNNRGITFDYLNQYPAALKHFFAGLTIQEKLNNPELKGDILGNIGLIYMYQNLIEKSRRYHKRALTIRRKINDKHGISASLNNLAILSSREGKYQESIENYLACIKIDLELNDVTGLGDDYNNIGIAYLDLKNYDQSLVYLNKALEIRKSNKDIRGISETLSNFGTYYHKLRQFDKAREYFLEAIELAKQVRAKESLKYMYRVMTRNEELSKDTIAAYLYYKLFIKYRDSIDNSAIARKQTALELNYQFDKEKEVTRLRQRETDRQYMIILIAVSSVLILILLFSILFFRKWKQTQAQQLIIEERNRMVEQKNDEILASINYAKRIQHAILPSTTALKEAYPEHFTLYLPKDIVSGDFYWINERDNIRFLAVADCTGHGVPGALMSVVCHNALNRALHEFNHTSPAAILDKTRELVINELSQRDDFVADGMDISLCAFNINSNIITWAGANNPLWIYRKSINEIEEIKADKQPIGNHKNPTPFKEHQLELYLGDRIYLFTDGFQDQFGGEKLKKLMRKGFKNAILESAKHSIDEQNTFLIKLFKNWQGSEEQVDDVCVIGLERIT